MSVAAIASGFQMWSGLQQAEMMRGQGEIDASIKRMNAKYALQEAWEAEQYGYTASARYKAKEDQVIGQQNAIFAAQGIDPTSGTARQVQNQTKLTSYLNTLDIQKQARRKAKGLKFEASNLELGADTDELQSRVNASATERAAIFGGVTTYIGLSGYGKE